MTQQAAPKCLNSQRSPGGSHRSNRIIPCRHGWPVSIRAPPFLCPVCISVTNNNDKKWRMRKKTCSFFRTRRMLIFVPFILTFTIGSSIDCSDFGPHSKASEFILLFDTFMSVLHKIELQIKSIGIRSFFLCTAMKRICRLSTADDSYQNVFDSTQHVVLPYCQI